MHEEDEKRFLVMVIKVCCHLSTCGFILILVMHIIPKQDSFLGIFAGLYKLPGLIIENKGIHAV